MLTEQILSASLPNTPGRIRATVVRNFNLFAVPAGINTPHRIAAFLAQVGHESGSFRYVREIASGRAYEGRKDLGNVFAGDGVRYKGRSYMQVTGRRNYLACSLALFGDDRLLRHPELLESPENAMRAAVWFWNSRNLSLLADLPDSYRHPNSGRSKFERITRYINGGLNGWAERLGIYQRARRALGLPVF